MFKLLTEKGRQKVSHEYATRRVIVIIFAVIFVEVVGVVGLLPSYILSNIRHNEAQAWAEVVARSVGLKDNEAELQTWLLETNKRLVNLSPKLDIDRPSDFVEKVVEQKTKGISMTNFSWIKTKKTVDLSVSGVASDRKTLVAFEDGLNSSGNFSNVNLPISDLAKDKDISFQIKFSLK